jgi:hypothetical protein
MTINVASSLWKPFSAASPWELHLYKSTHASGFGHHRRAGDGNRTRTTSLEGSSSTIELHPRALDTRAPTF